MNGLLSTFVELLGAVLIVVGFAMFSIPLSFIVAGILTIGASYMVANK